MKKRLAVFGGVAAAITLGYVARKIMSENTVKFDIGDIDFGNDGESSREQEEDDDSEAIAILTGRKDAECHENAAKAIPPETLARAFNTKINAPIHLTEENILKGGFGVPDDVSPDMVERLKKLNEAFAADAEAGNDSHSNDGEQSVQDAGERETVLEEDDDTAGGTDQPLSDNGTEKTEVKSLLEKLDESFEKATDGSRKVLENGRKLLEKDTSSFLAAVTKVHKYFTSEMDKICKSVGVDSYEECEKVAKEATQKLAAEALDKLNKLLNRIDETAENYTNGTTEGSSENEVISGSVEEDEVTDDSAEE